MQKNRAIKQNRMQKKMEEIKKIICYREKTVLSKMKDRIQKKIDNKSKKILGCGLK